MLLALASFEKATRLFGFVGLTFTKLSAWLPVVALTLTTGSRQVSGVNRSVGTGARYLGFMHLRVPSGTSGPSVAASTCACKVDMVAMRKAKMAASVVRRRRMFICVFLFDAASTSGLKRTRSDPILR